jgi:signal transduction histidine kinase
MLQPLKEFHGKLVRFLPKNRLRTEYVKMVNKLKTLEAQVENSTQQLEIAKSNFLKNVYHEIRTPLNSIIGFTSLLSRENRLSDVEKEGYMDFINKSNREFLRVMDDIIQASLLEAGMININSEACNLKLFLDENQAFFSVRKHIAEKNSVALLLSINDTLNDVIVSFDKFRVTQVLTHLIDNAIKNSEKGIVEYGCTIKDKMIVFFVKDTVNSNIKGKEKLVFGKFSKLETEENSKGGLGLGLSICKNIVDLMEGTIWYQTENGKGSTFYFSIPYVPAEIKEMPPAVSPMHDILDPVLKRHNLLAV